MIQEILEASKTETWHVVSKEDITISVHETEKDAKLFRDNAAQGYYKDCDVKKETLQYDHWKKHIVKVPKDIKGLWLDRKY